MEIHLQNIKKMCRICHLRAQTYNEIMKKISPKLCKNYQDNIYMFYGIDVEHSDETIHPDKICKTCFQKMKNALRSKDSSKTTTKRNKYTQNC